MASLPSLTELGLLRQPARPAPSSTQPAQPTHRDAPWWTTLEGDADTDDNVFHGLRREPLTRSRKRRAVSPNDADQDKPTLSLHIPDADDVPELVGSEDGASSPDSSPESSPEPSPHTSPETAAARLALPLAPQYLLPLPVVSGGSAVLAAPAVPAIPAMPAMVTPTPPTIRWDGDARDPEQLTAAIEPKRKRPSPTSLANLLSPTPNVYCLYKFDRVDQLGGKRRGLRH